MRWFWVLAGFVLVLAAGPARAEITESSPTGFVFHTEGTTSTTPDQAYRALGQIGRWWSSAHSYSGDTRRHMTLDLRAGGCMCERWDGNSVEHARVIMVLGREGARTVRLSGGLGPLQQMGVSGILTFTLSPDPAGTKVTMDYRVAGDTGLHLDAISGAVDQVLLEQFSRFISYSSGGTPG